MKFRYSKFDPDALDGVDLEDLLSRLSDLLLSSGFNDPYSVLDDEDGGHSMQALHDAILEALLNGALSDELLERLLGKDWQQAEDAEERIDRLVQQIVSRLQQQGYITAPPQPGQSAAGAGPDTRDVRFEITDKSLDFLGYRALRDLLGSVGKSSVTWRPASKRVVRRNRTSSATR
jgi:Ca-activated chloride channel family protein